MEKKRNKSINCLIRNFELRSCKNALRGTVPVVLWMWPFQFNSMGSHLIAVNVVPTPRSPVYVWSL